MTLQTRPNLVQFARIDDPKERRIAAALDAAQIGVFEFEPATGRTFWDRRVRELWGVPDSEETNYDTVISQVHPDDRDFHDSRTERVLDPNGSRHMDIEYRMFPRGGHPMRWIHAVANCHFEGDKPVRLVGTVQDVTARRASEERNKLLAYELEHRVKNTLSTALAVVKLSRIGCDDFDQYVEAAHDRLHSMAAIHDTLRRNDWNAVDLDYIIDREAQSFLPQGSTRLRRNGPTLTIPAANVPTMSMALHELFTNASKYGALSNEDGYVELRTHLEIGVANIVWKETGGTMVKAQKDLRSGFGSFLLSKVLPTEMQASVSYDFEPNGAVFTMEFPLKDQVTS